MTKNKSVFDFINSKDRSFRSDDEDLILWYYNSHYDKYSPKTLACAERALSRILSNLFGCGLLWRAKVTVPTGTWRFLYKVRIND